MSLKKVRGGVTGFGDTLVSKTCGFFLGSHVRGGGGGSLYQGNRNRGLNPELYSFIRKL